MTERTAALKVYVIWAWLAQNPDKNKDEYPLFEELCYIDAPFECPWCHIFDGCTDCPLVSCREGSLHYQWASNPQDLKLCSKCAGEIARIAWAEYKRLEVK